jgi:hypothetical protein
MRSRFRMPGAEEGERSKRDGDRSVSTEEAETCEDFEDTGCMVVKRRFPNYSNVPQVQSTAPGTCG